jgi:hypothetical protein
MSLLEGNGFIMIISCGVSQERNTRLTCNVSMTCGKLLYMGWVLPTYNTIDLVYMATYVMNWYSMPEVQSVTSAVDHME